MTVRQSNKAEIEDPAPVTKAKSLRVRVLDNAKDGRPAVNVNVPIGMVRWGMNMARTFSPETKDLDLDWDAISAMIDEGARGQIVHVEDEEHNKTIEVWVE
jgi:hypothetical protein